MGARSPGSRTVRSVPDQRLRGDLGESFTTRRPVLQDLRQFLPGNGGARGHRPGGEPPVRGAARDLGGAPAQPLGRSPGAGGVPGGCGRADLLDGPDRPPRLLLPSRVGARAGSTRHAPSDCRPPSPGFVLVDSLLSGMASASPLRSAIPSCRPSCWGGSSWASSRELPGRRCSRCSARTTCGRRGPRGSGDRGGGCARSPQRLDSRRDRHWPQLRELSVGRGPHRDRVRLAGHRALRSDGSRAGSTIRRSSGSR